MDIKHKEPKKEIPKIKSGDVVVLELAPDHTVYGMVVDNTTGSTPYKELLVDLQNGKAIRQFGATGSVYKALDNEGGMRVTDPWCLRRSIEVNPAAWGDFVKVVKSDDLILEIQA